MAPAPLLPVVIRSLAGAMVLSSATPLLLLDGELIIIAASRSFCSAFGLDIAAVDGQPIATLGHGEWQAPRLRSLLTATASGGAAVDAYELDLAVDPVPRRLIVTATRLDYDDAAVRLLVAFDDVTERRLTDARQRQLVQEKAILLQELHHRVANSLQIIASVLMQSARRTASDEVRGHLADAHRRVMSVAALQRQLFEVDGDVVPLRPYFEQLCASIGASMIADPERVRIEVMVDASRVPAESSISLGLIVTELVINALRHAFPEERHGCIRIEYHVSEAGWQLSVADDGIGMGGSGVPPVPGLGTTIVNALVERLKARLVVSDAGPGTRVTIAADRPIAGEPDKVALPAAV